MARWRRPAAWLAAALLLTVMGLLGLGWFSASSEHASLRSRGGTVDPHGRAWPGFLAAVVERWNPRSAGQVSAASQPAPNHRLIGGRVTADGQPAAHAEVFVVNVTRGAAGDGQHVTADAAGRFSAGRQPPGLYAVGAALPGFTGEAVMIDTRNAAATPAPDAVEVSLFSCRSHLRGTVVDEQGTPLPGAQVQRSVRGRPLTGARTNDAGAFEMCLPQLRYHEVSVRVDGYGALQQWVFGAAGTFEQRFVLSPEGVLMGLTVRRGDGTVISGASVQADPVRGGLRSQSPRSCVSDAEGHFFLDGMAGGRFQLTATAPGLATSETYEVAVEPAGTGTTPRVLLRLSAAHTLSGAVLEEGSPVVGAQVTAHHGAVGSLPSFTGPQGRFALNNVPPGRATLKVHGFEVVAPHSIMLEDSDVDVTVEVRSGASVSGRVLHQGNPVVGAQVSTQTGTFAVTRSLANGQYHLTNLAPGTYVLRAELEHKHAGGQVRGLTLARQQVQTGVDIELSWSASVVGVVVAEDGTGVPGVAVQLNDVASATSSECITDGAGRFECSPLPVGEYQPVIKRTPHASNGIPSAAAGGFPRVSVPSDDARVEGVRLVVRLDHAEIAGHVVNGEGQGQPDVRVSALAAATASDPWQEAPGATTNTHGAFAIRDLSEGTYDVRALAGDGRLTVTRAVPAGQRNVVMTLSPVGRIQGQLEGFAAPPDVVARGLLPEAGATARAAVDQQTFNFEGLAPGTYKVMALSPSGGAVQDVDVHGGQTAKVTLKNTGSRRVQGRVVAFRTGAPVAGARCQAAPFVGNAYAPQGFPQESWTQPDGRYDFDAVPLGLAYVLCSAAGFSDGIARVPADNDAQMDVTVVQKRGPLGLLGAKPDWNDPYVFRIVFIRPGQPAQQAGLELDDVVTGVDGRNVQTLGERAVEMLVRDRRAGTPAQLEILRAGTTLQRTLTVGAWQ